MPISDPEWNSVRAMAEAVAAEVSGRRGDYFLTETVIKRDVTKKLVWVRGYGDQAIPVVSFNHVFKWYDDTHAGLTVTADTAWQFPNYAPQWGIYGSGYDQVAFRRLTNGVVFMQGLTLCYGAGTSTPSTIFTLPAGYRPAYIHVFPALAFNNGLYQTARIDVLPSGAVVLNNFFAGISTIAGSAGNFVSLAGLQFFIGPDPGLTVASKTQVKTRVTDVSMPKVGDTVLIAREMGIQRLPRCLGTLQDKGWMRGLMSYDLAISEHGDLILAGNRDLGGVSGVDLLNQRIQTRLRLHRGSWF
jgi:hypothetical protein